MSSGSVSGSYSTSPASPVRHALMSQSAFKTIRSIRSITRKYSCFDALAPKLSLSVYISTAAGSVVRARL